LIRLEGDPILSEVCPAFDFATQDAARVSAALVSELQEARGYGLAAPQIGIRTRAFALRDRATIFNPEILARLGGEERDVEGCLSYPGVWLRVRRARVVRVRYWDIRGGKVEREFAGHEARCFQHEPDHLEGRTLPDFVPAQAFLTAKIKARQAAARSHPGG
jgi:peptide deformylase